ncbi:cystathionine gamma-synthase [Algicola sagamiensis]|uniref:cystathionine gamma-synthase n=1 Tax=Algicola sagamiensis TaxID=163869 RepID=UPI0003653F78|nr:cystathionine gamma-synthase [Algicola sagamiensis]
MSEVKHASTFARAATIAVRAGIESDTQHGSVVPPIHLSSNFSFAGFNQPRKYDYSRSGNPTRDLLGEALAELEQGEKGIITSTGMSAVHLVTQLLSPEDVLVIPHDCYGGSYRLFTSASQRGLFQLKIVDFNDPEIFAKLSIFQPKLIWLETPSNPLLRITDIEQICGHAKTLNALVCVDNTFLSPVLQQPLTLGADIVIHSTTKYINGHSDVVGGAVIAKEKELGEELAWWANCIGITGAPFDSYLTLRGLRTLYPRLKQHLENTQAIVEFLAEHPAVEKVYYPGLADHPGHAVAKAQQHGFGAMVSFELVEGQSVADFVAALEYFSLAESLGGVESLICHPATMTHAAMDKEAQKTAGISEQLLRVSVGIENADDLIQDLAQALNLQTRQTQEQANPAIGGDPKQQLTVSAAQANWW